MCSPRRQLARSALVAIALVLALTSWTPFSGSSTAAAADDPAGRTSAPASHTFDRSEEWRWPLGRFRMVEPYVAPAHRYAPGHRGIDLEPVDATTVRAPASGVVAFSGVVAGRGILTIDHGDGLVTTLEPVDSALAIGITVAQGDEVATVAIGGHTRQGALHFGVRLDGEYINPMTLLGGVPRAVLLPCC